ncbi:CTLH/CRA C-terminal to lish motif domain-containing protein, partial [Russula earlei]
RTLILDYLVQCCYTRTARAFAADSTIRHLDADGDEIRSPRGEDDSPGITEDALHQADLRRDVQISILSGRIDDAIDRLNANFPSTLPSPISTCGDTESPIPRDECPQSKPVKTVLPFTVEPAHLYLDLRILGFIEASRTKPLPYPLTASATSDTEPIPPISLPNNFRDPSGEVDGDAHLARLLKHVHELYDCAQALQDPHDRAEYQHELSAVSSLLAYKVPEQSPMAKYLTQERREVVADEVNSAILHRAGSPPISYLEHYVRYNTVIWNYMNEHEFRVAPSRGWPTGVVLPSQPQPNIASTPSGAKAPVSRRDESEVCRSPLLCVSLCLIPYLGRTFFQSQSISIYLMRGHNPSTLHTRLRETRVHRGMHSFLL